MDSAVAFRELVDGAARRVSLSGAAAGAALALLLAALGTAAWPTALTLALVGAAAGYFAARSPLARTARRIERRAPACRNVVITAADVASGTVRTTPAVASLLYQDAVRVLRGLEQAKLFPIWRALAAMAGSGALWALVAFGGGLPSVRNGGATGGAPSIASVEVTVTPPAYAGSTSQTMRDPARIEALEGSTIQLAVRATGSRIALETLGGTTELVAGDRGTFTGTVTADADGFIAIEARGDSADAPARRLIGLSVVPDAAPGVRITAPGRDLFIDSVRQSLAVTVEAQDDIALTSLVLRYTKVSGSGEQFTFVDGEVALNVTRTAAGQWTARGMLPLDTLNLAPGDVVVYRGVARDNRPGAPATESDAFLVELSSPVGAVAGGFAIDDEEDRYGVSQQMVIQMSERLVARRSQLASDDFTRESQTLAAAQRRVRAEFVFMLGGELEDDVTEAGALELHEEAHAAADADEAIAGRLRNQNRLDLLRAIRAMARAATALNDGDPARALPDEREALSMLQRAFSRTRYILRTLNERERIDMGRRLTGSLATAVRDARPAEDAPADPRVTTMRRALADIAGIAGGVELTQDDATQLADLARALLRLDASSQDLQSVAASLSEAASAIAQANGDAARAQLDAAALRLAASLRASLHDAPREARPVTERALGGALADVLGRVQR